MRQVHSNFMLQTDMNEKAPGSYYTPESLIQCLLDSALDTVIDNAVKKENPEKALLDLKICDPAAGSGHFLIAASHRLAKRLAAIRTGDDEPSPESIHTALRDVISHCIYGVDINPMAVELCKVSLWLEAMEPGKPLSFLEHRIKCGNSLIGTTPELLANGILDNAFKPVIGDDKTLATQVRNKNRSELRGQSDLFSSEKLSPEIEKLWNDLKEILNLPEEKKEQVERKRRLYRDAQDCRAVMHQKQIANLWVSAFFWPLNKEYGFFAPTQDRFSTFQEGITRIDGRIIGKSEALAQEHKYFHWHLEFPEAFELNDSGFDCVLGNPPWETWEFKTKDFFKTKLPKIPNITNTSLRNISILELKTTNPELFKEFECKQREYYSTKSFMQNSILYTLSNKGKINLYSKFLELYSLIRRNNTFWCRNYYSRRYSYGT